MLLNNKYSIINFKYAKLLLIDINASNFKSGNNVYSINIANSIRYIFGSLNCTLTHISFQRPHYCAINTLNLLTINQFKFF